MTHALAPGAAARAGLRAWLLAALACCLLHEPAHADAPTPQLWRASSATATVYLFGAMHFGTPALYPLPAAVLQAYEAAAALAVELDSSDARAMAEALAPGWLPATETLETVVHPGLAAGVQRWAQAHELDWRLLRRARPWLAALWLTNHDIELAGYSARLGIDAYFLARAHEDGKRVIELETAREQIRIFEALDALVQERLLQDTLQSVESGENRQQHAELVAAWKTGDGRRLAELTAKAFDGIRDGESLRAELVDRRNQDMAEQISKLLAGREVVLVVVGIAHLVGTASILKNLRQREFVIEHLSNPTVWKAFGDTASELSDLPANK